MINDHLQSQHERFEQMKSDDMNQLSNGNKSQFDIKNKKTNKSISYKQMIAYSVYVMICLFVLYYAISKSNQCSSLYESNRLINRELDALSAEQNDKEFNLKETQYKRSANEKMNQKLRDSIEKGNLENSALEEKERNNNIEHEKYSNQLQSVKQLNEVLKNQRDTFDQQMLYLNEQLYEYEKQMAKIKLEIENKEKEVKSQNVGGSPIESLILENPKDIRTFRNWIKADIYNVNVQLLYRGSQSNFEIGTFHLKCDGLHEPLIILIKLENGLILGGFTKDNTSGNGFKHDSYAFVFNLSNQTKYLVRDNYKAIYTDPSLFIVFGENDLVIQGRKFLSMFPKSYGDPDIRNLELSNGIQNAMITEIEVFELFLLD